MKKFITLSVIVLLAFHASAQFQKGNKVLGFGLNVQSSKEKIEEQNPQTSTSNNFHLSTELGFATKENRLSGFFVGAGYSKNKYEVANQPLSGSETEGINFSGGYFNRIYKSLGKNFFVFGEGRASLNYSQQKNNSVYNNPDSKEYSVNVGLYPGLAYKWNQRFLFELRFADFVNVGYSYRELKGTNNQKSVRNSVGLGTSLGLGYLNNIGIGARWIIK